MLRLNSKILDLVQKKYNVLEAIDLFVIYNDLDKFDSTFSKYLDYKFKENDRVLILHHDTDYYISNNTPGFILYNMFKCLLKYNIPQEFLILFTNHSGIKDEVSNLSWQICDSAPMKTIYTALWYDFPDSFNNKIELSDIKNLYCCLNGVNRSHRLLLLSFLKEFNLLDKGSISYHFKNENF